MPPAALRGRLRGERQGEALIPPAWRAPGPPICTAWLISYVKLTLKLFYYEFRESKI